MRLIKSTIAALGLVGLLVGTAKAEPKLQLDVLVEVPAKQAVLRTTALADLPGNVNVFAFADYVGNSSGGFYSEANVGREIYEGLGGKLEWNGGSGIDDVLRFGPNYVPMIHDKLFLDVKLYPLTVDPDSGVRKIGQLSAFGRVGLPWKLYVENWTDLNVSYDGAKPNIQTETTVGKDVVGNLSVEAQHAHNVNLLGEQARVGLRYKF